MRISEVMNISLLEAEGDGWNRNLKPERIGIDNGIHFFGK